MAPKRKNDDLDGAATARDKKKQKMATARNIEVQSMPASGSSNAVAGSSTGPGTTNSMQGLPTSIDVERFAEARAFEINAMQEAMENAKGASTHRAWQELPRHLRRRAASHDVRRVPLRLREKARAEMDPVKRKAAGKHLSKPGKGKKLSRTQSFLKRQQDKLWLETHIWHAKRMHMKNKWGYRLAITPTEKAYRPSHRASVHGSILHDASYHGLIELKGAQKILAAALDMVCDPQGQGSGAKRFTTGARVLETHAYEPGMYPLNLIAPISVLWRTSAEVSPSTPSVVEDRPAKELLDPGKGTQGNGKKKQKGKGKAKAMEVDPQQDTPSKTPEEVIRTVWVRAHPSAFDDVFSALQTSVSLVLDRLKAEAATAAVADTSDPINTYDVELADLREQFNVFEIVGPKSSQVLKGALKPVPHDGRAEFQKFWSSLSQVQSSGCLPRGMVVGFTVLDPRLDFPPKNAKAVVPTAGDGLPSLSSSAMIFPSSSLAQSDVWEEQTREKLCKPKFKKKDIDARKSKNLVPGTALQPSRQDDRIPLLLIQRSIEPSTAHLHSSRSLAAAASQGLHGWTLVLPAGWGMPFLTSLVHTGTRVGGLRERAVQLFEAGSQSFPRDYVGTQAFREEEKRTGEEDRERWEKKPPAKRVDYESRGIARPWAPDWEEVLGLPRRHEDVEGEVEGEGEFVPAQREGPASTAPAVTDDRVMDQDTPMTQKLDKPIVQPWLLRGQEVDKIVGSLIDTPDSASSLLEALNNLRAKRGAAALEVTPEDTWKSALVNVQLSMCGRGKPIDHALMFALGDDEWARWREVDENADEMLQDIETSKQAELGKLTPPMGSLIGYVTTGNFSLSLGESSAIGAIPLAIFVELIRQQRRLEPKAKPVHHPLIKVKDRDGLVCRLARLYLLQ